jgi:peptidoglycan/LPS O-acetylase OafA/YrhL
MGFLRVLLAISVVVAHSSPLLGLTFVRGATAVQIFYVISGFYMAMILTEKYNWKGCYRDFIINRALKIYPSYWAVALVTLILLFFLPLRIETLVPFQHAGQNLLTQLFLIVAHIGIFFQDLAVFMARAPDGSLYFTASALQQPDILWHYFLVPQVWTLSLELTFYLLAPFLNRLRSLHLALLIGLSILVRVALWKFLGLAYDPWTYRFFPNEIAFFLVGMLQYRAYKAYVRQASPKTCQWIAYPLVFGTMLLFQHIPKILGAPLFYATTIALLPVLFQASRRSAVDRWVGELSYPVYVVHFLIVRLCECLTPAIAQGPAFGLVATVASLAAAVAMQFLIIRPIERIRQGRVEDHRKAIALPAERRAARSGTPIPAFTDESMPGPAVQTVPSRPS